MNVPTSESNDESRRLNYADIRSNLGQVRRGDVVTGFEHIEDLDEYVPSLLGIMCFLRGVKSTLREPVAETYLSSQGDRWHRRWPHRQPLPSVEMRPELSRGRPYRGLFTNISAVLVSTAVEELAETGFERASMLLSADMQSAGRSGIGSSCKLLTYRQRDYMPGTPYVSWESVEGDTADIAARLLMFDSDQAARMANLEELGRVMLMGAPGLGEH